MTKSPEIKEPESISKEIQPELYMTSTIGLGSPAIGLGSPAILKFKCSPRKTVYATFHALYSTVLGSKFLLNITFF